MAFINFIETFFFISLGITFLLIVLLVYHFKHRMFSLEQKNDTMFEIINDMIKKMSNLEKTIRHSVYNSVGGGFGAGPPSFPDSAFPIRPTKNDMSSKSEPYVHLNQLNTNDFIFKEVNNSNTNTLNKNTETKISEQTKNLEEKQNDDLPELEPCIKYEYYINNNNVNNTPTTEEYLFEKDNTKPLSHTELYVGRDLPLPIDIGTTYLYGVDTNDNRTEIDSAIKEDYDDYTDDEDEEKYTDDEDEAYYSDDEDEEYYSDDEEDYAKEEKDYVNEEKENNDNMCKTEIKEIEDDNKLNSHILFENQQLEEEILEITNTNINFNIPMTDNNITNLEVYSTFISPAEEIQDISMDKLSGIEPGDIEPHTITAANEPENESKDNENNTENINPKKKITMQQLRSLVVSKGIVSDVSGLRKNELIKLLDSVCI